MAYDYNEVEKQYRFADKHLPDAYAISDGKICKNTKDGSVVIAEFIPVILGVNELYEVFSKRVSLKVIVAAIITGEFSERAELTIAKEYDIADLDMIDFQNEIDYRCYMEDIKSTSKILGSILRKQLAFVKPKRTLVANRLGHFKYEDKHGFIAGNRVLGTGLPDIQIADNLTRYTLIPDGEDKVYNSELVETYVYDLIHLNDRVTPVLFTANILGVLHDAFLDAGEPIKFSLYVKGEQSTGKTTAVSYMCSMYNRADDVEHNLHNLTATDAKLNLVLDMERDMPVIIDDLRLSDSQATMRQQEARLDNLIRVVANNVGRESMRYEYDINGFVIFIGEYALKNPSTNNRIVLLEFRKEDLDKKRLSKIVACPEHLSWFFMEFIKWSLDNYDSIVNIIKDAKRSFMRNRECEEQYQERLQNHCNTLLTAYEIFTKFCEFKGWNVGLDLEAYHRCLDNIITDQIESLELDVIEKPRYIVELYQSLSLEECDERIYRRPRKDYWTQRLYMDKDNGLVYLPGSTLTDMLEGLKKPTTMYYAMNEFESAGLLKMDKNKKHSRTKKLEGKRCYVIDYPKWKEYVEEIVTADEYE